MHKCFFQSFANSGQSKSYVCTGNQGGSTFLTFTGGVVKPHCKENGHGKDEELGPLKQYMYHICVHPHTKIYMEFVIVSFDLMGSYYSISNFAFLTSRLWKTLVVI